MFSCGLCTFRDFPRTCFYFRNSDWPPTYGYGFLLSPILIGPFRLHSTWPRSCFGLFSSVASSLGSRFRNRMRRCQQPSMSRYSLPFFPGFCPNQEVRGKNRGFSPGLVNVLQLGFKGCETWSLKTLACKSTLPPRLMQLAKPLSPGKP